jgi:ubiquinone/menaquinone biosynthesis C-methylase UbiE
VSVIVVNLLSLAPFVPSSEFVVEKMLELVNLKPGEKLFDLGSGDGRIIIMAAKKYNVSAVGIELREDLVEQSRQKIKENHLEDVVKVIHGNFLEVDLSTADAVTMYLTTGGNTQVKPKLEKELKAGARIVSHDFEIPGWVPAKIEKIAEEQEYWPLHHTVYLYERL